MLNHLEKHIKPVLGQITTGSTIVTALGMRPPLWAVAARSRPAQSPPLVVVCASTREASQTVTGLRALGAEAALFPSWETLPHEQLSPRVDTMGQRIDVMRRLRQGSGGGAGGAGAGAGDVGVSAGAGAAGVGAAGVGAGGARALEKALEIIVMPVRSLIQPLIPGIGDSEPLVVRPGDEVPLAEAVARLVELGYRRCDLVTKRGEIAVRGGILDIFVPTADHPARIEFFGDEVDEIRSFQVSDQRSIAALDGLVAGACAEMLLTDEVRGAARVQARDLPGMAQVLEAIGSGIVTPGMESLAPILYPRMESFAQLVPGRTTFFLSQPELIARRCEDLIVTAAQFQQAAWESAAGGGRVPLNAGSGDFFSLEAVAEQARAAGHSWVNVTDLPGMGPEVITLGGRDVQPYRGNIEAAAKDLTQYLHTGWTVLVTTTGPSRLAANLNEQGIPARITELDAISADPLVQVIKAPLSPGFIFEPGRILLLTEADLTGRGGTSTREMRKMPSRRRNAVDPLQLQAGDFVVHDQHGVGRFVELTTRTQGKGAGAITREYVVLEYAPSRKGRPADRLYVPTDTLDQLSKYTGGDAPSLNKMGGADWEKTKNKARKAVREIAAELVRIYAARQATEGHAFAPDTPWQAELEDAFEYVETPDQLITIDEVKADMEKPTPMDRLLCGDVGYGKTEIAVRAAFKAVQDGKQVAVLVPTTLLAQQHFETFSDRYAPFPVTVAALSRFSSKAEAEAVRAGVSSGEVDVVIGTHALVTGQVRFKDLGLVIIDEEQRFGVEHKETLKALRANVDVLSMSATPIPRTLEMAVTGIRQMSTLTTPPEERHPVLTFVGPYSQAQMGAAIRRELLRDGQVFVIHNRVETIDKFAATIANTVPEARVRVAHGKLSENELERVIVDFWNREFDVLVCTTIVETGLDIANANTLIVDRADRMGLSQLHQLRGRVGRSRERAYAYFFYPADRTLTETAHERLQTIANHTDLGAGMAVAQKDLEIRGAGNLLGGQQSGHIAGVGFDLYVRMVAEAVAAFTGGDQPHKPGGEVKIELPVDAHIPPTYLAGERLRLETYTKLASAKTGEELDAVREELVDRYGPIPAQVDRLFMVARLRQRVAEAGLTEVVAQGRYVRIAPIELAESQMLRLKRLYPGSIIKTALRQVLVTLPQPKRIGESALQDEAILDWVARMLDAVTGTPPATTV